MALSWHLGSSGISGLSAALQLYEVQHDYIGESLMATEAVQGLPRLE